MVLRFLKHVPVQNNVDGHFEGYYENSVVAASQ